MADLRRLLYVLLLTVFSTVVAQNARLPGNVRPTFYALTLNINPEADSYIGTVNMTFDVLNDTAIKDFYFHAASGYIYVQSLMINNIISPFINGPDDNDIIHVNFSVTVTGENNFVHMQYIGNLSTDGYGLVKTRSGNDTMVQSYFEPTYARRAFPCLDEPDLQANFSIQLTSPREYTALSNMHQIGQDISSEKTSIFATTPKISTSSVDITISNFVNSSVTSEDGHTFRVFTRAKVSEFTTVAESYYAPIVDKLRHFTGSDNDNDEEFYNIAVYDYSSDYTDNFGTFIYRETELLDEGEETTNRARQNIITAMTYKLNHEWFGGKISPKWWSDVWTNEAVANYLKYMIPDKIASELDLSNQFVVEVVQKAMFHDAMPFAQPLSSTEEDVNDVFSIENKLDTSSFLKGAAVLHMVNYKIGDDIFENNLQYHLHNRSTSDGDNFLRDLTISEGLENLYDDFFNWAYVAGFPLLGVEIVRGAGSASETIRLSQKRFVYPTDNTTTNEDVKWSIPISVTTSVQKNFNVVVNLFYHPNTEIELPMEGGSWIIANLQGRFQYRVNYDKDLWWRLISSLRNERIEFNVLNRAQMVDDIFNIARTGDVTYSLAFELATFLKEETEYYPWYSAFEAFSYLLDKVDDDVEANLKLYILDLMRNVLEVPGDTHIDVLKRTLVLDWACYLGDTNSVNYAVEQFEQFKQNQSFNDNNLRGVIFCNGIRHSKNVAEDWQFLWDVYNSSLSAHEQNDILEALGCAKDTNLLAMYLQKAITPDSGIKRQDTLVVFKSVFSSSVGVETAMEFLRDNFAEIHSFYNGDNAAIHILSDMILALAEKLVTDEQVAWLENLLTNNILDNFQSVKSKATTLASVNNYWVQQHRQELKELFPATSTSTISSSSTFSSSSSSDISSSSEVPTTSISTTTDSGSRRIFQSRVCIIFVAYLILKQNVNFV